MGRTLDALLGRNFRASKFRPLLNLAVSRLAILTNQRRLRRSQAQSDVLQLLQLHHQQRALLRVEQVIKDQNALDAYVLIEGYLNLLIERASLLEQERECPEELKEALAGLLFAASRCGDFPELHEIKSVLTSRFGKEFTARAVELRNNCGVNHLLMQKLSTRHPNLESRMDLLKTIASENGITLQLDETPLSNEARNSRQNQSEPHGGVGENLKFSTEVPSGSKQKYKDVADAAQAAFESAAQAAAAARAAMELSRSESQDPDGPSSPGPGSATTSYHKQEQKKSEVEAKPKSEIEYEYGKEEEGSKIRAEAEVKNSMCGCSSNRELFVKENREMDEQRATNIEIGEEMEANLEKTEITEKPSFRLNLEKKPISVRTRRVRGY
ncbi:IST1-like protein, partial [Cucurbita argyrosperma subsp. sororia]